MRAELCTKTFFPLEMRVTHRINEIEQVLLAGLNRTGTLYKQDFCRIKRSTGSIMKINASKCVLCYRKVVEYGDNSTNTIIKIE